MNLWKSVKAAGMGVPHVNRLLTIANNDLPAVELRYERSKKEAATLEYEKENSAREFQQVNNQRIMMRKTLDSTRLDYEKEMERLRHLQQERVKQEAIVKHFENSNEVYYITIRKTVEEKVISVLSDRKMLLKLPLLSLTESMRKDPDKFNAFIFCDNKSSSSTTQTRSYSQYCDTTPCIHQQQYPPQDYISMLIEESGKLYNKLDKELGDEIMSDYAYSISPSSLPLLPPANEEQKSSKTNKSS